MMAAARCEAWLEAAGMVLAVVAVPMAMGGRHPAGQIVLTAAAIAAATAWAVASWRTRDGTWRIGPVEMLFGAGLVVGLVQILPLPAAWIAILSPQLPAMLPHLVDGPDGPDHWNRLSLTPGETLAGLGVLVAQGVLATMLVRRTQTARDAEALLTTVAISTAVMAVLGLVQYVAGNGRYLWFYEFAYNDSGGIVKGTFTNRNHFAGFLAVGLGAVVWWTVAESATRRGSRRRPAAPVRPGLSWRQGVGWLLAVTVAFAAAASLSRGGTLAILVAATVSIGLLVRTRGSRLSVAIGLVTAVGFVAAALGIHGWDRLRVRLEAAFAAADGIGRLTVWRAAWNTLGEFPWLGAGVGSHADIAPRSLPPTDGIVFTHAENSYLNLAVEAGVIGLGLAITALVVVATAVVVILRRGEVRERAIAVAILSAMAAATVHAVVDFVWYVPAYSTVVILLGSCVIALAGTGSAWLPSLQWRTVWPLKPLAGVAVVALLVGIGARQVAAARGEIAWEEAVKHGRQIVISGRRQARLPARAAGDPSAVEEMMAALTRRIDALERCVSVRPDHPRAWTQLALARMDRFGLARHRAGSSLGIADLRAAAVQARFTSAEDLHAWLERATGPAYHDLTGALVASRRAVAIAPCSGEAWCVLSQLAFLRDDGGQPPSCLLAQAMLVRPNDSLVLFEAANEAAREGDTDRAVELWRRSFTADGRQRQRIIAVLLPWMSSAEACELLEPDLPGLRAIDAAWSSREPAEALTELRSRRIAAVLEAADAVPPPAASILLLEAAELQERLGQDAESRASLRRAVQHAPGSYEARRRLALAALAAEDWVAARQALEWCLLRRPHATDVREKLETLRGLRLGEKPRVTAVDFSGRMN